MSFIQTDGLKLHEVEKLVLSEALMKTHGHVAEAAALLGISTKGMYNKIRKHKIEHVKKAMRDLRRGRST